MNGVSAYSFALNEYPINIYYTTSVDIKYADLRPIIIKIIMLFFKILLLFRS